MIHVYTGNGKGKTTAALGLIIRALGNGLKVCLIQFMKKNCTYGEIIFLKDMENIDIFQYGTDRLIDPEKPEEIDFREAESARAQAEQVLSSGQYDLVVLDEINVAVKWNLLSLKQQLDLTEISGSSELVMTGRYAASEIVVRADLVTEMLEIKHYFTQNITARKGIEY